jgi:predicted PurR-regulated permease PerM
MRTLAVLVGIVILLTALHAAASIVVPLLLGATIAVAFQPLSDRLEKHGAPPLVSAAVTIVVVLAVVGAIGALMVIAAGNLTQSMPQDQAERSRAGWSPTTWPRRPRRSATSTRPRAPIRW